ncbi:hypothetical protein [Paractinoplanes deccanensis]|nr:hypothetical protein [Actinoplanes deccanensis]
MDEKAGDAGDSAVHQRVGAVRRQALQELPLAAAPTQQVSNLLT